MSAAELTAIPAVELAELIATRLVSAGEVVEAHLRRIEEVDGAVNAIVALDADGALAAARERDSAPADGRGRLHGVPFTVKDNIAAAGLPMAIGAPERADVVPDEDATAVARLRSAGAILLGKTNCPPYGGGIETDNAVYGRTSNPYDTARTPGGSSGGEAAAIAAGCSPCGLGTDSGASVRLPAHFCGLASIKPTAQRVPVTGVIDDEGQIGALGDPRTQIGVLARSVADVALLLRLIAGPDGRDAGVAPVALGDPADVEPHGLRIAVQIDNGLHEPTRATVEAVERAAATLRESGAVVEHAEPPRGGHELTIEVWRSYDEGPTYRLLRRWDAFRGAMLAFPYDVILGPVFPEPARLHGDMNRPGEIDPTSYTTPHSLTGWPAATVPAGSSPEGLPICVQVAARPWRDDVALAAALQVERVISPAAPAPRTA